MEAIQSNESYSYNPEISNVLRQTKGLENFREIRYDSIGELLRRSDMDYDVATRDICLKGSATIDGIPVVGKDVITHKAICRTYDNGVLGVVGQKYSIIQNQQIAEFADNICTSFGCKIDAAGVLSTRVGVRGARIGFYSDLGKSDLEDGTGDMRKQMVITSSHDGSCGMKVILGLFRMVCSNGLMAFDDKHSNVISIKHSGDIDRKLALAAQVTMKADKHFYWAQRQFERMGLEVMSRLDMGCFLEDLIPDPKSENGNIISNSRAKKKRNEIMQAWSYGPGQSQLGNTKWKAYQAITDYADHYTRPKNMGRDRGSASFERTFEGSGMLLKRKAFELLTA